MHTWHTVVGVALIGGSAISFWLLMWVWKELRRENEPPDAYEQWKTMDVWRTPEPSEWRTKRDHDLKLVHSKLRAGYQQNRKAQ